MAKYFYSICTSLFLMGFISTAFAQNVGINSNSPQRTLEVADSSAVFVRINSLDDNAAGVEFFSTGGDPVTDWRLTAGTSGNLLFQRHPTEFAGLGQVTAAAFTSDGRFRFGSGETPNAEFDFHKSGARAQMWLTASNFVSQPSYNLVSGVLGFSSRHWRMGIEGGDFVIQTGESNFGVDSVEAMHIDVDGNVGIGISNPTTELHLSGEMQMATAGFSTAQKDKIAIRGILEDATMLGLGWLRNSGVIEGLTGNENQQNRSLIDTYEMYYKSEGAHRWFINQNADLNTTPPMILNPDGWLGLGPIDPESKLHITGGPGASLIGQGYMQIGNTTSTNLVFDPNEIQARSNGNASTLFFQFWGGNLSLASNDGGRVAIGHSSPQAKLHVTDGDDVSLASGGELVLGLTSGANLAMDGNEIQGRNGGAASELFFQAGGGDLLLVPNETGQVGIGVTSSATMPSNDYLLAVDGKIISEEVRVELSGSWPDYVFTDNYQLQSLPQLEAEIDRLGHLPGIPSAATVEADGILLGDMQRAMMEKIEELTLYVIDLQKQIEELKKTR